MKVGNSFYGNLIQKGAGGGLSTAQKNVLKTIEDPQERERLTAQFALQAHAEMISFISNIMKKQHEASMAIISNLR